METGSVTHAVVNHAARQPSYVNSPAPLSRGRFSRRQRRLPRLAGQSPVGSVIAPPAVPEFLIMVVGGWVSSSLRELATITFK